MRFEFELRSSKDSRSCQGKYLSLPDDRYSLVKGWILDLERKIDALGESTPR